MNKTQFENYLKSELKTFISAKPKGKGTIESLSKKMSYINSKQKAFTVKLNKAANSYIEKNSIDEKHHKQITEICKKIATDFLDPTK